MKPVIVCRHKDGETHFAAKVSAKPGIVDKWTTDRSQAVPVHPDVAERIGQRHARTPGGGRLRFRDPATNREEFAAVDAPERAERSVVATMAEAAARAAAGPDAAARAQIEGLSRQLEDLKKKHAAECLAHEKAVNDLTAANQKLAADLQAALGLLNESAAKPPASPPVPPAVSPATKS